MVKRQFEDQEDAETTPQDETGIDDAGGAAAAPAAGAAASGCSPRWREEPAAAPAFAEPAPIPAVKATGWGVKRPEG